MISHKGFYFKDYKNLKYEDISTYSKAKLSLKRLSFVFFVFLLVAFVFATKIVYLASLKKNDDYLFAKSNTLVFLERQDILDRNHNLLAKNVNIYSGGISPKLINNKVKLMINLRLIFPELNIKVVEKKIDEGNFFYLKRRLNELEWRKLKVLGDKSIILEKKQHRIYPQESLFSHVLGQIDDNNFGVSGIEKSLNAELIESDNPLVLTLDSNLQHIIRQELLYADKIFQTAGSAALLMEINTGEILSLISLPDFDLNERINIEDPIYLNKITKGVYELGSVFKTFTLAAGLESKKIDSQTVFKNLENKITCAGRSISEHDKLPSDLDVEQILIRSSNIGSVRIAQKVGIDGYRKFLDSLELFNKMEFDLEEVGTPLQFKWGKCKLATASFGHGITTTPLQLSKAYAIIGNGGYKINPTILQKEKSNLIERKKIISTNTSKKINSILRKVVANDEGTANFANVEGYEVGGKTGSAYKSINGQYSKNKINTFISLFPISKPQYVLLVMLDEPKPAPNYVYTLPSGFKHKGEMRNTSGWNAVVVAGKIIEKIGPILAIKNLQASTKY